MRKGLAVRGPLLAVAAALVCWLLLAAPAPRGAGAGIRSPPSRGPARLSSPRRRPHPLAPPPPAAPMVASTSGPGSTSAGHRPRDRHSRAPEPLRPPERTRPARVGGLDPRRRRERARSGAARGDAQLHRLGARLRGLLAQLRHAHARSGLLREPDRALPLGLLARDLANAGLALVVMWGGFNVMVRQHIGSPYHGGDGAAPPASSSPPSP